MILLFFTPFGQVGRINRNGFGRRAASNERDENAEKTGNKAHLRRFGVVSDFTRSPLAVVLLLLLSCIGADASFQCHGFRTVNTTAELRDAINATAYGGCALLHLPEGNVYHLGAAQLRVYVGNVTLRSEGAGATLDAGGCSRHVDVALGGKLQLERVHLVNGGAEVSGGSALVRFGGELTVSDGVIASSEALDQGGAIAVQDYDETLRKIREASIGASRVNSVAYSPDGSRIVSGDDSGNVITWEAGSLAKVHTASSGAGGVYSVAYSPDGSRIVSGDDSGNVITWEAGSLAKVHTASSGAGGVTSVAYSPDGSRIVSGDTSGNVITWEAGSLAKVHTASSGAGR